MWWREWLVRWLTGEPAWSAEDYRSAVCRVREASGPGAVVMLSDRERAALDATLWSLTGDPDDLGVWKPGQELPAGLGPVEGRDE